jgi:ABC-type ATPase with predicted acetyltransferase domain
LHRLFDRLTARILAVNLRKFARQFNTGFVLASPNNDFVEQLGPEVYIEKAFSESPKMRIKSLKPPMDAD